MSTNTFLTMLAGASLLTAAAITGCDANQDQDPYAEQQTRPADESTATRELPEPGSTERSVASERMASAPADSGAADPLPSEPGNIAEADVIGKPVLSQDGEEIGTVAQVVADDNGESEFAVVEVGEFLGIGEKQVAIDVRHLSVTADGKVQSNVTADALQSMPEYQPADYEAEPEEEDAE